MTLSEQQSRKKKLETLAAIRVRSRHFVCDFTILVELNWVISEVIKSDEFLAGTRQYSDGELH